GSSPETSNHATAPLRLRPPNTLADRDREAPGSTGSSTAPCLTAQRDGRLAGWQRGRGCSEIDDRLGSAGRDDELATRDRLAAATLTTAAR
uniref:Uncharacterized protein n=1 Tax=Aegilops tauschii subsp. strangulata TaxID=200361 RepID=A0A453HGD8_AEGTS